MRVDSGGQVEQDSRIEAFARGVQCSGAYAVIGGDPADVDLIDSSNT